MLQGADVRGDETFGEGDEWKVIQELLKYSAQLLLFSYTCPCVGTTVKPTLWH